MTSRQPLQFFILTFVLSVPFWILQCNTSTQFLPGIPLSALAIVTPTLATIILVYQREGWAGIRQLLGKAFDFRCIKDKAWYIPLLFLYPSLVVLSYFIMRINGADLPIPKFQATSIILLAITFFAAGLSEELGWSGYVTEPLQMRLGILGTGFLLGCVWAAWHWIPLIQVHRSFLWISWWTLYTVSARVIMVWLFYKTGKSVFGMTLFHMTLNLAWQLFPVNGSYFDMRMVALLITGLALIIALLTKGFRTNKFI